MKFDFWQYCQFYTLQNGKYYWWKNLIIKHMKVIAITFFTRRFPFFDHGLTQSIHFCWLSLWYFFEQNFLLLLMLSKLDSKSTTDLGGDLIFIFIHYKMVNLLQTKTTKTQLKMAIYSRSFIQNFDNWWFWTRKNKHIA